MNERDPASRWRAQCARCPLRRKRRRPDRDRLRSSARRYPSGRPHDAASWGAQNEGASPKSVIRPTLSATATPGPGGGSRVKVSGGLGTGGDGHRPARLARISSTLSTASRVADRSTFPPSTGIRRMVVVPVRRLDTQIVTRFDPRSRSRTIANVAVADCSSPAVSTCESTSTSGSIGNVMVRNGAAASSPVIRASALRVTSSSAGDTRTTTSPRQEGVAPPLGAVAGEVASASAVRSAIPVIGRGE